MGRRQRGQTQREIPEEAMMLALKMEEETVRQECKWPLEAGKRKGILSQSLQKEHSLVDTLILV